LPSSVEQFLVAQSLPPRSVVVELNGEALAPSEFAARLPGVGDRREIVKILAGVEMAAGCAPLRSGV
jgi:sulfur carrier protein ThiS